MKETLIDLEMYKYREERRVKGMQKYKILNFKLLMELTGLNYANDSYGLNQDIDTDFKEMPRIYWKDGEIVNDYTYIQFMNIGKGSASIGDGVVTKNNYICEKLKPIYVKYKVRNEKQLDLIINILQEQLGLGYILTREVYLNISYLKIEYVGRLGNKSKEILCL